MNGGIRKMKAIDNKELILALEELEKGTLKAEKQPEEFTLAPMIFKENCKIDWSKSACDIRNLVRGVNPAPGAWTTLDDKVYKIWNCEVLDTSDMEKYSTGLTHSVPLEEALKKPGTVLVSNSKEGLLVATGEKWIRIREIQAPNAKRMNILDYLRGNSIEVGSLLK